ncbi:N-acetylgalactosaminyltransferase 7-like [Amphiura filiformis]|uniref:N-acetylgalactosaminyltransferase 7-like n=1 Tax=Amphiura filiformis TaxID=82378 RepID=UPI003B21B804
MMYLTRRMRSRFILFGVICCGVVYLGRTLGYYVGDDGGLHRRKRNHESSAFRTFVDFLMPDTHSESAFEAVFKRDIIGNYEPSLSEPRGTGPGAYGEPVTYEEWETQAVRGGIKQYSFNQYVSDKIPFDRPIPDLRPNQCSSWHYSTFLPSASIIITFHNEGWSTLLRTVTSVVNRTPTELLKEIILVDDFSTKSLAHLHKELGNYIATSTKFKDIVYIVRNRRRLGVMASRMEGTHHASGQVLVFMDAHCEVGINWLPPLLTVVARNSSTIAIPIIDMIDNMKFSVYPQDGGELTRGLFDWNLDFKRIPNLPEKEMLLRKHSTEPYRSPVMAGNVFAVNKAYFLEIGSYDTGLQMGGAENFELSFKVWMCGGCLLWVPCSRVGHLDRINNIPPYTFPGDTPNNYRDKNLARVATIWMDEYRDYVYISRPRLQADNINIGDIKPQLMFRQEKQCKDFNWYMQEIAYDVQQHFPLPPLSVQFGEIRVLSHDVCLDTKGKEPAKEGTPLSLFKCHGLGGNQLFRLTTAGDIRVNGYCLGQHISGEPRVMLTNCRDRQAIKDWTYDEDTMHIRRKEAHRCLQRSGLEVQVQSCAQGVEIQLWTFENPYKRT